MTKRFVLHDYTTAIETSPATEKSITTESTEKPATTERAEEGVATERTGTEA